MYKLHENKNLNGSGQISKITNIFLDFEDIKAIIDNKKPPPTRYSYYLICEDFVQLDVFYVQGLFKVFTFLFIFNIGGL